MSNEGKFYKIAVDKLKPMNLTKHDCDPKKEPYVNDRKLASQLGCGKTTVFNARQSLIFLRENGIREYGYLVYAWRWSGDNRYAKIGHCEMVLLKQRMIATYHPTDDPILIGIQKYITKDEADCNEKFLLGSIFTRTRPDREWVIIDEAFNEIIDKGFIRIGN